MRCNNIRLILKEGEEFNKELDESIQDLIKKQEQVRQKIIYCKNRNNSHMTLTVNEYTNCIPEINAGLLKNLLTKDIQ